MTQPTLALLTLGCKVNQAESATIINFATTQGYELVSFQHLASIYIINSCTVTHVADQKTRQMLTKAHRTNPDAHIILTGCGAVNPDDQILAFQLWGLKVMNLQEVISFLSKNAFLQKEAKNISTQLSTKVPQPRTRTQLLIQTGCDCYCTYCIVPYVRGAPVSRLFSDIISEAKESVAKGTKEIVVTGINVGMYTNANKNLIDVLTELAKISGLMRLRLSSIELSAITPELINCLQNLPIIMPHLHLPLQSGSNKVLKRMNRNYSTEQYASIINQLRQAIPGIALTTDIIAGFPNETDNEFLDTLKFVAQCGFSQLHVFGYSPRTGTAAARFSDQITESVKKRRVKQLLAQATELQTRFLTQYIGSITEILVEATMHEKLSGLTPHYQRVTIESTAALTNQLIKIKIASVTPENLMTGIIV